MLKRSYSEVKMLSVEEVSDKLGVSKSTMHQWISKKINCGPFFKKVGRTPLMAEIDFERYLKELPYVGEDKK